MRCSSWAFRRAPQLDSSAQTVLSGWSILIFISRLQVGQRSELLECVWVGPQHPAQLFPCGGVWEGTARWGGPRRRVCSGHSHPLTPSVVCPPQPAIATPWALLARPATRPQASVRVQCGAVVYLLCGVQMDSSSVTLVFIWGDTLSRDNSIRKVLGVNLYGTTASLIVYRRGRSLKAHIYGEVSRGS